MKPIGAQLVEIDLFRSYGPENLQLFPQLVMSRIIEGNQLPDHLNLFTFLKIDVFRPCFDIEFLDVVIGLVVIIGE